MAMETKADNELKSPYDCFCDRDPRVFVIVIEQSHIATSQRKNEEATVLDKEEIRRKRNRLSAEKSRLKLQERLKNLELEKESEMHRQASLERYVSELMATKVKLQQSFVSHNSNCVRKYRLRQDRTLGIDQLVPGPDVMRILPPAKHQSRKVPNRKTAKPPNADETEMVTSNSFLSISQSEPSSNIQMITAPNIPVQLTGTECKSRNVASLGATMPAQVVPQIAPDLMSIASTTGSHSFSLNVPPNAALPIVSSNGNVINAPGSTVMTTDSIRILSEDEVQALRLSPRMHGHIPVINIAQIGHVKTCDPFNSSLNTSSMPLSNIMSNVVTNSDTCQPESVLHQTESVYAHPNVQDTNYTDVVDKFFESFSDGIPSDDDGRCIVDQLLSETGPTESGPTSVLTKDRSDARFSSMQFIDDSTANIGVKTHGNPSPSTALLMETMISKSSATTPFETEGPPMNSQAVHSAQNIFNDSEGLLWGRNTNRSARKSLKRVQMSSDVLGTNDLTNYSTCMSNWTMVDENKNNSSALMVNGGSELPEDILEMAMSHDDKRFISTYDDALDFLRH